VRLVLIAIATSLAVGLFLTPLWIRWLRARGYAQSIRDADELGYAVPDHASKQGTPSMGGVVIVAGAVLGYAIAHLYARTGPSASALLVFWLIIGLAAVGFADDYIKIFRQRSTGLRVKTKLIGQAFVALVFGVLALQFPNADGYTPATQFISFVRDTGIYLPLGLYLLWVWFMVAATSNAVNLTDGLDGLATGAAAIVFGAYVTIGLWQYGNGCAQVSLDNCYAVRNPLDLGIVAAGMLGSCFGFLWWNAAPAKISMGDTGSLALVAWPVSRCARRPSCCYRFWRGCSSSSRCPSSSRLRRSS
jgi:phospho-N-acetylmuramoyl-pentapeptide-transferase